MRVDVVDDGVVIEGQLFDDRDAETVGTEPTPIEASGGDLYSMRGYVDAVDTAPDLQSPGAGG